MKGKNPWLNCSYIHSLGALCFYKVVTSQNGNHYLYLSLFASEFLVNATEIATPSTQNVTEHYVCFP